MHWEAAPRQFGGDGGSDGGLAHAALAHRHDDAAPARARSSTSSASDSSAGSAGASSCIEGSGSWAVVRSAPAPAVPECQSDCGRAAALSMSGQACQEICAWQPAPPPRAAPAPRRAVVGVGCLKEPVEDQPLIAHADGGEFAAGALGFGQRGLLRAADQHQRGARRIRQRSHGGSRRSPAASAGRPAAPGRRCRRCWCRESRSRRVGNVISRRVWPVGAVSKMTWSKPAVAPGSPSSRENSSKAAISSRAGAGELFLHALAATASGSLPRYGPTSFSR